MNYRYIPAVNGATMLPTGTIAHYVGKCTDGDIVLEYLHARTSLHRWHPATFAAAWAPQP